MKREMRSTTSSELRLANVRELPRALDNVKHRPLTLYGVPLPRNIKISYRVKSSLSYA